MTPQLKCLRMVRWLRGNIIIYDGEYSVQKSPAILAYDSTVRHTVSQRCFDGGKVLYRVQTAERAEVRLVLISGTYSVRGVCPTKIEQIELLT